jgi:NhaA family Na+:H+ antiporter
MIVANSPAEPLYERTLGSELLGLSVLHWINDGLMAVFFVLVGLEIKRELLEGELATWPLRILPGLAALGGMILPALIYLGINVSSPQTLRGWAIPAATDIAFSLGVLAVLGRRVPLSIKVFLTAVAILDDLGAIIIIALFYSGALSQLMLAAAAVVFAALLLLNRFRVMMLAPYLALGAVLWFCVLKSGIHATIAGVLLAAAIPLRRPRVSDEDIRSPLHRLETALQPWVLFLVMPIFGFANAGLSLAGVTAATLLHPVTLGCMLGLFLGKQLGIFGSIWLAVRTGIAHKPAGASWMHVYGMALLCGIGFTMSLFIAILAFGPTGRLEDMTRMGVLSGSLLSALAGWLVLRLCPMPANGQGR